MLKAKKVKFIICGLLGLMTLTSCTRDFNAWLGATFNLDPILFQDNFSAAARNKYNEVSENFTVDDDNDSLTQKDVFEDTVYSGHPSYLSYIKQVYEWVEVKKCDYIDFNVYNRHFEEDSSAILTNEYVETLKSDPTVIYMCKIISDDPYLNGRYYNEYIKLVDNNSRSYPYNEKGLARLYKKADEEQTRTAEFYKKFGEQGKTGRYYFENDPHLEFEGYDYYGEYKGDYTVELEEIHDAPIKIKCPYFKNLDSYDFVTNTEFADFWIDKYSFDDLIDGKTDYIDSGVPDGSEDYNSSTMVTTGGLAYYKIYAKRDMIIDSVSCDVEVIQIKEFDEKKEESSLKRKAYKYPKFGISNTFSYDEIDKKREWNSYWYGKHVGTWMANWWGNINIYSYNEKYSCNGCDDWYLKEGYINHFETVPIEESGYLDSHYTYIIKKGMPLCLKMDLNIGGGAFSYKISNVQIKFRAVTFKGI